MRTCVYCKTRYEKGSAVTFHKFPSDYYLKLWLKNMKIVNWTPKTCDYLCSKHFIDSCFIKHQSRTTLKKCSIPTIFLETNSPSLPVQVESVNYDFLYSEINPKRISPCETLITHTATAVPSTSFDTSQCSTPKRQITLAEMSASVKLDHRYENTPKSSKKSPCETLITHTATTETNSPLLPVQVDSVNYDDFQYSEINPKRMSPCETPITHTATTVPSTSFDTSQCSTPKRQITLAEMSASVKLDHRYENTAKSSKKEFKRVKAALKVSQARVKVLSQHVKRLKISVSTLQTVNTDLKRKMTDL